MEKIFTLQLGAVQLNMIGQAIETAKTALDSVALDVQNQVNAELERDHAARSVMAQKVAEKQERDRAAAERLAQEQAGDPESAQTTDSDAVLEVTASFDVEAEAEFVENVQAAEDTPHDIEAAAEGISQADARRQAMRKPRTDR